MRLTAIICVIGGFGAAFAQEQDMANPMSQGARGEGQ